jgi:hypothetical protein
MAGAMTAIALLFVPAFRTVLLPYTLVAGGAWAVLAVILRLLDEIVLLRRLAGDAELPHGATHELASLVRLVVLPDSNQRLIVAAEVRALSSVSLESSNGIWHTGQVAGIGVNWETVVHQFESILVVRAIPQLWGVSGTRGQACDSEIGFLLQTQGTGNMRTTAMLTGFISFDRESLRFLS